MAKKNKLNELDQVDGKIAGGTSRSLDALIGEGSCSPYISKTEKDYEQYISELNATDLDRHAQKVGLAPTFERRVLKERLLREYRKFLASTCLIDQRLVDNHMNVNTQGTSLSKQAQKILSEGR